MSKLKNRIIILSFFFQLVTTQTTIGIGNIQTNVPWKAGHASAFEFPYVIVYGGSEDSTEAMSTQTKGSNGLWIWDIRNGSWYQPTVQVQGGVTMLPQIYFKATNLPSQGQIAALVSNTTGGLSTGVLQKLDINSWSWSFPTTNFLSSAKAAGYSMLTIDNTIYTYGGLGVDLNGYPNTNSIQNTLSLIDTSSFQWTSGSNGLGLTDHTTCYLKKCNCLLTFGGTRTGNPTDVIADVYIYDLNLKVWNVQGIVNHGSAAPGARRLHTANCLEDSMVVYGGGTTSPSDTDVWLLNATSYPNFAWQRISVANSTQSPSLRMGHSSVYDETNKKIYIYGGWGVSATNDSNMYVLDVVNWSWTIVPTTGYPIDALPPTTIPDDNNNNNSNNSNNDSNASTMSTGAIVGIAIGGLIGLLAILAILFLIRKKRREKEKEEDGFSENIQHHELKPSDHNPYYYNNNNNNEDQGYYTTTTNYNNATPKQHMSTRNSFARRSEIGDSDRVVTGILEELNDTRDDGTVGATHGSRSPRESFRNSKVLLVTPTDYVGQGQVPNEIISQKPNEFSIPALRFQQIPIDHHTVSEDGAPLSSSMEVLRSIKTNGSSMMNQPGSHVSSKRTGVPITHATTIPLEDDENWTFADSLSVNPPIQYILPNSRQLSNTDTSTQTWDTKDQRLLVDHHYPSSTLNMPLAQAVTPPTTTNNSSNNNSSNTNELRNGVNIYNTVSPLDVLASLGQSDNTPSNSRNPSSTMLTSTSTSNSSTPSDPFQSLTPLISALPRRYTVDKSKSPITGPSNHILFVKQNERPMAVKSFARREAWERECRTLIKLKSPCVVEILEVLTIQNDVQIVEDEEIKYVTVMERLDETLSQFIRQNKKVKTHNGKIAKDILACLSWCHSNGIAFCDLKPSNIMRNQNQAWKLIDFEGSRTINEECVGVITPRYCPPEVARATTYGLEGANGVVATASVDLWSFGCVIYELETKKALFSSTMKDETILHFISHPSPSTPILNNGLRWNENKELEIPQLDRLVPNSQTRQLIKTLLCREPNKRGSATQLLDHPYFA